MDALELEQEPVTQPPAGSGCVAHVLIFGFDHDVGNVLEFAFPALESGEPGALEPESEEGSIQVAPPVIGAVRLPAEWCHLPFQALPDGVHREVSNGAQPPPFFFTVPARTPDALSARSAARASMGAPPPLHATACYRQLRTAEVRARQCESPSGRRIDGRITRNAVQKSVVVLCNTPLYGLVSERVADAANAFAGCGFAADEAHGIMRTLYEQLNDPHDGLQPQADAIASSVQDAAARLQRRRSGLDVKPLATSSGGVTLTRARSMPACPETAGVGAQPWRPPHPAAPAYSHGSGTAALLRMIGGRAFLGLVKAVLLQRRVVIYGEPAGLVSAAVLGVAACLPCALEQLGANNPHQEIDGASDVGGRPSAGGSWIELGLPPEVGQGWLSGGAVCGFQPHASLQALGEVLAEGDSGGRLLGCSPNVAMLLAARMKRDRSQSAAQHAAPSTPHRAVGSAADKAGGSAPKVPLPSFGGGAGDLRCDVMYSLGEKGAVTFCSAELEGILGKLSKAENAFAARLQTLVERHESELLIADADVGQTGAAQSGAITPSVAARQQTAAFALETRLHTLMHSYVGGAFAVVAICFRATRNILLRAPTCFHYAWRVLLLGMLVVAGASEASGGGRYGSGGGGGSGRESSMRAELALRHRKAWITAWQRTAAYHVWAAGLRQRRQEAQQAKGSFAEGAADATSRRWPAPELAGPDELRRAATLSSPREAAGGTVYGAVAGAAEIGSWGVGALAAGAGGAGRWVSWAVGGESSSSSTSPSSGLARSSAR